MEATYSSETSVFTYKSIPVTTFFETYLRKHNRPHPTDNNPEDGGIMFLRNVGDPQDYNPSDHYRYILYFGQTEILFGILSSSSRNILDPFDFRLRPLISDNHCAFCPLVPCFPVGFVVHVFSHCSLMLTVPTVYFLGPKKAG
jgi:hypothetical protein